MQRLKTLTLKRQARAFVAYTSLDVGMQFMSYVLKVPLKLKFQDTSETLSALNPRKNNVI